jgi:outer membrane lipoprotein-sorting protein
MQASLALTLILQLSGGQQVAAKCASVYRSAKTLQVRVVTTVRGSKCTAEIYVQKPKNLRVFGTSMFGSKYDLLATSKGVWVQNAGSWESVPNLEQGLASVTGVSANTATHVPALAFGTSWGALFAPGPISMTREKLGAKSVYHLRQHSSVEREAWIEEKSYLLLRTSTRVNGYIFLLDYTNVALNKPIAASTFVRPK